MNRAMRGLSWLFVVALPLAGCSSMSGYDAKSSFSCKAPDGVLCESMSGIYANVRHQNLPGQQVKHASKKTKTEKVVTDKTARPSKGGTVPPMSSGMPIRSAPRILRVWFAPWEDSDQDLHDQSYLYLLVDTGHWRVEHAQQQIQNAYRPVHAPIAPKRNNPISTSSSIPNPGAVHGQDSVKIGVRQDRPDAEQSAQYFDGVRTPQNVMSGEG